MNYLFPMDILQPLADLPYDRTHILLRHPVLLPHPLKQLPLATELNQQIDALSILKVSVEG